MVLLHRDQTGPCLPLAISADTVDQYIDQHSVDISGDYQSTIGQYIAALLTDSQSSVG